MRFQVTTTHATPAPSTLYLVTRHGTLHTCPSCGEVLGYSQGAAERCKLDSIHCCKVKPKAVAPEIVAPFN